MIGGHSGRFGRKAGLCQPGCVVAPDVSPPEQDLTPGVADRVGHAGLGGGSRGPDGAHRQSHAALPADRIGHQGRRRSYALLRHEKRSPRRGRQSNSRRACGSVDQGRFVRIGGNRADNFDAPEVGLGRSRMRFSVRDRRRTLDGTASRVLRRPNATLPYASPEPRLSGLCGHDSQCIRRRSINEPTDTVNEPWRLTDFRSRNRTFAHFSWVVSWRAVIRPRCSPR